MNVPAWVWAVTLVGLLGSLTADVVIVGLRPRQVTMRQAAAWVVFYVACAGLFGAGVLMFSGTRYAWEFVAGYVTEYALSADNLFVFAAILSSFAVPRVYQHRVLLAGILVALGMRGLLILAGAAMIAHFGWVFYVFGGFLVVTAMRLARSGNSDDVGSPGKGVLRILGKIWPGWRRGERHRGKTGGTSMLAPLSIVMIAVGVADVLFALDSIPAIFGLTKEPYLVFTANAFALMGLSQFYFLISGLLHRLVYLSYGLAVILSFVGVKLILEALHENSLPFIYGGQSVPVPTIGVGLSLTVVAGVLLVTAVASLLGSATGRADPDTEGS